MPRRNSTSRFVRGKFWTRVTPWWFTEVEDCAFPIWLWPIWQRPLRAGGYARRLFKPEGEPSE